MTPEYVRQRLNAAFRGLSTEIIVRSREVFSTPIERGQLNGDPQTPFPKGFDPFIRYTPTRIRTLYRDINPSR